MTTPNQRSRRAHRVAVRADEPLIGSRRPDYADAFEIRLSDSETRSPEELFRDALEQAVGPIRWTTSVVHRYVLRLRLAPRSSPGHLFGWRIITSQPDVAELEAVSSLLGRAVLIGRTSEPGHTVLTTYLFYERPALAPVILAVVWPLHRRGAPYLLERAPSRARAFSTGP